MMTDEKSRERNPDLLTALSLLTLGTYNRLPTSLTESFLSRTPLTNGGILATLRRLDQHILYRLRCVDYLPPEFAIEGIRNGRVYLRSGGFQGWKAQMTVVGFDEDARWWLTGVEWEWRIQETGVGGPGGQGLGRLFGGEERQQILDLANGEVLPRRQVESSGQRAVSKVAGKAAEQSHHLVNGAGIPVEKVGSAEVATEEERKKVDAPLVRIYNFLRT